MLNSSRRPLYEVSQLENLTSITHRNTNFFQTDNRLILTLDSQALRHINLTPYFCLSVLISVAFLTVAHEIICKHFISVRCAINYFQIQSLWFQEIPRNTFNLTIVWSSIRDEVMSNQIIHSNGTA